MFEKIAGQCQLRGETVEVLFVDLKKSGKSSKTPVRCMSAGACEKSAFCKFVNPLSNRIPVDFSGTAEAV